MLPITNSGSVPCTNLSSNCVIWQGPDIPCIELCTGDTISDVIAELAQKLCDISIPEINIDALDLLCTLPEGQIRPDTLEGIIQLIINEVCSIQPTQKIEQVVPLGCLSYDTEEGDGIFELPITEFSVFVAQKICDILDSITIIQQLIQNHETRISILEGCVLDEDGNCLSSTGDPEVYSSCILSGQTIAASVLLVALEETYCNLETAVGSPPLIVNAVNQAGCITSSEPLLSGPGTYGAISGWASAPNTLADAVGNAWIVICDMHQAIKDIQLNCCPGACDSVVFAYDAIMQTDTMGLPEGIRFTFLNSNIPEGFVDCGGNTTITITDVNGVSANQNFVFTNYAGTINPFFFGLSTTTLNLYSNLTISIPFCVTNGVDECEETLTSVVESTPVCPSPITIEGITEEEAVITFDNTLGNSAIFTVTVTDLDDGSSNDIITVSNLPFNASIPLSNLEAGTNYQIVLELTINGVTVTCTTETFVTESNIPSCPTRRVVIQICNENSARDDNFDIILNGTQIGAVDLNTNAQVGSVFIADINPGLVISSSDFACPLAGMVQYNFTETLLQSVNSLQMINTQNNGNGNFGTIGIRNYEVVTDATTGVQSLANPCVIDDLTYSMPSGQDASFTFNYDECCPGDTTPTPSGDCKEYTVSTTGSGSPYSYTDCEGVVREGAVGGASGMDADTFCALEGTVDPGSNSLSDNGDCTL